MSDLRPLSGYWLPLGIALMCLAIAVSGDAGRELLRYQRDAIAAGEWWRFVSGHLAHLGARHLLLNLAGLGLVWLLVGQRFRSGDWALVLLATTVGIGAGFWFLDRGLDWYVGLSGVLHGLLLAGAVAGWNAARAESVIVVVVVAAKLAWEQVAGPLPGSEASAGGNVIVNAHLYGGVFGIVAGFLLRHRVRTEAPI